MKKIFILIFLVHFSSLCFAQIFTNIPKLNPQPEKPVSTKHEARAKKKEDAEIRKKQEQQAALQKQRYEQARIEEAKNKAERERLAEIERQNQLAEEKRKAEELRKNKEVYDKHLRWSKNMIDTNGITSCKNDSDCRKMVMERLQLALTYYNGEEAKNYLKQLQ